MSEKKSEIKKLLSKPSNEHVIGHVLIRMQHFFSGGNERYCGGVCGYFGGGNDGMNAIGFGAGGYSYISGYKDCLVFDTKISTSITHYQMKTNSFHDSNLYLTDIVLMTGHRGDGKIRITNLITFKEMNCKKNGNIHYFISVLLCYNRKNI